MCTRPDRVNEMKQFSSLEDGSIRGDRLGTGPWWFQSAGIQTVHQAHRASAWHCVCEQTPWHLGPGLEVTISVFWHFGTPGYAGPCSTQGQEPSVEQTGGHDGAWFLSSIIQGLQISQGPTGAFLWTALSGKGRGLQSVAPGHNIFCLPKLWDKYIH